LWSDHWNAALEAEVQNLRDQLMKKQREWRLAASLPES